MEKSPRRQRWEKYLPSMVPSVKTVLLSRGHACEMLGLATERSASNPRSATPSPTPPLAKDFPESPSFPSTFRQSVTPSLDPQIAKSQISSSLSRITCKRDYENLRHFGLINTSRFLRTHTNLPSGITFKPMSSAGKNKFVPYFQHQIGISLRMLRRRERTLKKAEGWVTERIRPALDPEKPGEQKESRKSPMLRRAFRKVENLYHDRPFTPDAMEALMIRSRSPAIFRPAELEFDSEKDKYKRPKSRM